MLDSFFQLHPWAETTLWALGVLLLAWVADSLTKRYLLRVITRVIKRTEFTWDDAVLRRRVFDRLANVAPALVVYYGVPLVPGIPDDVDLLVQRLAMGFMVLVMVLAMDRFLTALNDIYSTRPDAKSRPIKGYLQIVKIVLYIAAGIVVISTLMGQRPTLILGGFGAMTAVLLLVFRDTILSLVASIQITQNDMVAVGDWIEMPKYGADGDVMDIALHTVKVQNWDRTITTIPTHKLVEDSFKNWRGMRAAGGRRIKRSFHLDMNTVRFLTDEEVDRLGRWELLKEYIEAKLEEIEAYNRAKERREAGAPEDGDVIPYRRRLTNIGTLRAYLVRYLRQHPGIHKDMILMVRQLQPGPEGLPMEVYAFTNDTNWVAYEGIQADIFDHILATVPEFGLRAFQSPSGRDLEALRRPVDSPP
jgi:miniconductance mechanosensitive channel